MPQEIRESVVMDRFERTRATRNALYGSHLFRSFAEVLECLACDLDYAFYVAYTERA